MKKTVKHTVYITNQTGLSIQEIGQNNDLNQILNEDFKKRTVMLVDQIPEKQKSRYHINEDALITLPSGEIVAISNQWGIVNIELLIEFVRQNGFVVEKAEQ